MRFFKYLIILSAIIGFFVFLSRKDEPIFQKIKIGEAIISAEVAQTPPKRAKGLSERGHLEKNGGMLFVYDKTGFYSIWMKDMKFSIDIVWIDENKKIIEISKNIEPNSFPKSFQPKKPVFYILEINAGWSDKNGIQIGDVVDFLNPNG